MVTLIVVFQFKPFAINNNELADFISRVPDNEELVGTDCHFLSSSFLCQKNFKELTAADEVDKKTLAKMKKNAARDADLI